MIKLKEAVDFTKTVSPLCLPDTVSLEQESFMGINCVAIGWGMRVYGARLESNVKEVVLPVIDNSHCSKMYGMMHNIPINYYHLCAGYTKEQALGTCVVSNNKRNAV